MSEFRDAMERIFIERQNEECFKFYLYNFYYLIYLELDDLKLTQSSFCNIFGENDFDSIMTEM